MYAYIKGKYVDSYSGCIVVENNGIGYEIFVPSLPQVPIGGDLSLFLSFVVREDSQALYGFYTKEQKQLFLMLQNVKGVGAKVSMQILSSFTPNSFFTAVYENDIKMLTSAKGCGKKMAERIVVELKDMIKNMMTNLRDDSPVQYSKDKEHNETGGPKEDVIEALISLGFPRNMSEKAVNATFNESVDIDENLKSALKGLDKR